MSALLNEEEDEEFYKQSYGEAVFKEDNSDFEVEEEESWDELDTDFDDDEAEPEQEYATYPLLARVCAHL